MKTERLRLGTGLTYHVLEWGSDQPELEHTVILVHGFLDLGWAWVPTVRAGLEGRFHLVAPDMRGHGDSDRVGAGGYYHFFDYVADLHELVETRGRQKVSLVGHSMGGSICAYYAGAFPERISGLALLEGTGPPESPDETPDRVRAWLAAWKRVRPGRDRSSAVRSYASVDEAAERMLARDPLLAPDLARWLAERGTRAGEDGRLHFKHDPLHLTPGPHRFRVDVAREFWERVTAKVLLLEGGRSRFRHPPAEAEQRRQAFSRAASVETRVLPDSGHMMQRHQPGALAAQLADFLDCER